MGYKPNDSSLYVKILEYLGDQQLHSIGNTIKHVRKNTFNLSKKEPRERTKSGEHVFDNKIRWLVSDLRHAKLLQNRMSGFFRITEEGSNVLKLASKDNIILDKKYLMKNTEYNKLVKQIKQAKFIIEKKEKQRHVEKQYGLVALLDVLGTKDILSKLGPKEVIDNRNTFISKFKAALKPNGKEHMIFRTFSDTIWIAIPGTKNNMSEIIERFAHAARISIVLSIKQKRPIRGCFAIGEFYFEDDLFIGPAIDEAAQYYELAQWIGITATPSAHNILSEMRESNSFDEGLFTMYDVPLKTHVEADAWAIDWRRIADKPSDNTVISDFEDFNNILAKNMKQHTDVSIVLKWRNTRKFYNEL